MPCCFTAGRKRGVADELERVLAERKILQGQRHELRVRVNEAPAKLEALQHQLRKALKTQAEIVKLQRQFKARNARERSATASAAAVLASSPLFEEASLLQRMGLEPEFPCLLIEAWSTESLLLGEQWLNWEVLKTAATQQRTEVALEARVLLSREDEKKLSMQSTCGGSLLGSVGNLLLHFNHMDDTAEGKVLFRLHLSSKEPWKQSAIPGRITLKIWSWGGSLDSLKTDVEVRRHKSLGHANPSKTSLSCWLQAIGPLEGHDSKSKSADKISSDCIQVVSGSDEVLLLGRHHPLIQRFLEDRKELLSCISREHLRLWFDSKSEILFVENLSSNPIVIQNEIGGLDGNSMPPMPGSSSNTVPAGNIARMQNGDLLRFVAPDSLRGKLGSQDLPASFPLSFRVIVEKFDASCAGRKCQGGGGDPLYILKTDTSDHDHHDRHDLICCASCCAELHLANPTYAFRQTTETLPASWNLLCESQAVDVDMYPNATPEIPSGHSWAADFRAQKLHLPSVLAQGVVLKQKQAWTDDVKWLCEHG